MSVRVYDLVETVLQGRARFSRNRHFDAHQDEDFARAVRIARHLETIIGELTLAGVTPEARRDGDEVVLRYEVPEPRGPYWRQARFSDREWSLLVRYAPAPLEAG